MNVRPLLERARPHAGRLLHAFAPVLVSLLWAAVASLALDLPQVEDGLAGLYRRDFEEDPVLTLLGMSVVWVVVVLAWALLGRLTLALAVLTPLTAVLVFADYMKLELRLEPILPSDLAYVSQVGFLTEMVGLGRLLAVSAGLAAGTAGIVWLGRRLSRTQRRPSRAADPRRWWTSVGARVASAALAVSFLGYVGNFHDPENGFRKAYEANGADWAYFSQQANYRRNGFVGGVLYNLDVTAMHRPPGYSEAAMADIVERYTRQADRLNRDRRPDALDDVNVVVVLSESFTDPTTMKGVRFEEDPIPFTRRVMSGTTSGTMLAQKYGGGTANMEFEALTGMSMSQFTPQMDSPYQMLVPEHDSFPSAVRLFEERGHRPIAIHPYTTQMYRRESVYPIFGFDQFISEGEMQDETRIDDNVRISDAAAFDEVTYQIGRSQQPLLVNLVTMQNHYASRGFYDDPPPVGGVSGFAEEHIAGYVRGLGHSDEALRDFLGELEESPEKTAVVFYGDHHPPVWPGRIRQRSGELAAMKTPYFLWANFPLQRLPREQLTSPIHFLPMLHEAAGAQVPPYYALLSRLHEELPAMELGRYLERGGSLVTREDLSADAARVLEDYRLVQYDLAVGRRYSLEGMFGRDPETVSAAREVTFRSRD